jgi:hypothetical protein
MSENTKSDGATRRSVLIGAVGAIPLITLGATGAQAAKLKQAAVRYQSSPKDGKQCSNCNLFVPPNSCKSVDGVITPTGWCVLWVKKPG